MFLEWQHIHEAIIPFNPLSASPVCICEQNRGITADALATDGVMPSAGTGMSSSELLLISMIQDDFWPDDVIPNAQCCAIDAT